MSLLYASGPKANLLERGLTITSTNADANYPLTYLYDQVPSREFRFASAGADRLVTIDGDLLLGFGNMETKRKDFKEQPWKGDLFELSQAAVLDPSYENIHKRLLWLVHDDSTINDEMIRIRQRLYETPEVNASMRKVFGVAGALHQNSSRYGMRMAWPSAEWGSLPIAGGLEAAYRAEIEAAPDPAAKRAEIEQRIRKFASPMRGAERYDIEEIIDPRDTRRLLCEFAELAAPLRTPGRSSFGLRP